MKKLLGWISVVAPALALTAVSLGLPKVVAILLTLAFVTDPLLQVVIAFLILFGIGFVGIAA